MNRLSAPPGGTTSLLPQYGTAIDILFPQCTVSASSWRGENWRSDMLGTKTRSKLHGERWIRKRGNRCCWRRFWVVNSLAMQTTGYGNLRDCSSVDCAANDFVHSPVISTHF
jgi:hypothetical protein